MNITMKLFCVFFLSYITIGKASSLMGEDNGNIFANPNLRGLQGICSDTGNNNGGDCSNTPTICGSLPNGNGVSCRCENPRPSDAPPLPVEYCYDSITYNQSDCGGCSGSCAGRNNCLNLDFYCAEGQGCVLRCIGQNSCRGVTLHCPDNQVCYLNCVAGGSCVDAEVRCGKGTVAKTRRSCDPTNVPVSPAPDPTNAPVSAPTGGGNANACCSYDFKTCATWGNESRQTCEALGTMLWLENGPLIGSACLGKDTECTNNISGCCDGLVCQGTDSYSQCVMYE